MNRGKENQIRYPFIDYCILSTWSLVVVLNPIGTACCACQVYIKPRLGAIRPWLMRAGDVDE
jgi:hypothetical protein